MEVLVGSVTDVARVREATAGVEYVFHLAAPPAGRPGSWRRAWINRPGKPPRDTKTGTSL